MGKKTVVNPQYQLLLDFEEREEEQLNAIADHIRQDIQITVQNDRDYQEVLNVVRVHGGEPLADETIEGGETDEETIRINPNLSEEETVIVLLHELAHRLANSERYCYLNRHMNTRMTRREWMECLARRVSREAMNREPS